MANIVGDIAIQVGADIAPLVTGLGRAQGAVSRFGATATGAGAGMRGFGLSGTVMATAVLAAGAAVAVLTKRSLDNIDAMSKQARGVGLAVSTFQAMAMVADEAGVETDKLSKLIVKMQDNIANLSQGTTAQVDAFGRLGLSVSDLAGLGADEQFKFIAAAISSLEDPTTRTSAALDIFGKGAAEAMTMFDGYGAAVSEAAAFQREFGIAVSDLDAQKVEEANDAMGRMGMAVEGLGNQLAVTLAPAIIYVSESLTEMILRFNESMAAARAETPEVQRVAVALSDVGDQAARTAMELATAIPQLEAWGNTGVAAELRVIVAEMMDLSAAARAGVIPAEELNQKMQALVTRARAAFDALGTVDQATFTGVISNLDALVGKLGQAVRAALTLRASLPSADVDPSSLPLAPGSDGTSLSVPFTPITGPNTRPASPPNNIDFGMPPLGSGGGGSGGGSSGGGDALQARLDRMRADFASESDVLQEQHDARMAQLDEFRQAGLLKEGEYDTLEQQATKEHQDKLLAIEQAARSARLQALGDMFGDLSSLMQSSNDKLFKIGQVAAIAQASVSGWQAAVDAWQRGMKIGGPGLAAAFAWASLAKTGAMIASIAKQSSRGGAGGSAGAGGGGSTGGGGGAQAATPAVQRVLIDYNGPASAMPSFEALVNTLNEAGRRGYLLDARLVGRG